MKQQLVYTTTIHIRPSLLPFPHKLLLFVPSCHFTLSVSPLISCFSVHPIVPSLPNLFSAYFTCAIPPFLPPSYPTLPPLPSSLLLYAHHAFPSLYVAQFVLHLAILSLPLSYPVHPLSLPFFIPPFPLSLPSYPSLLLSLHSFPLSHTHTHTHTHTQFADTEGMSVEQLAQQLKNL